MKHAYQQFHHKHLAGTCQILMWPIAFALGICMEQNTASRNAEGCTLGNTCCWCDAGMSGVLRQCWVLARTSTKCETISQTVLSDFRWSHREKSVCVQTNHSELSKWSPRTCLWRGSWRSFALGLNLLSFPGSLYLCSLFQNDIFFCLLLWSALDCQFKPSFPFPAPTS